MADKRDQWADSFSAEPQGWLTGFLADEDKGGRRLMWRLGAWGMAAVGAVTVAVLASQSQVQWRRDQVAASDAVARQAQQLQQLTREAQVENRRLTQAIDTLNGDRDRLYTRVTSIEQGLESVTGSIKRQTQTQVAAVAPAAPQPAPSTPAPSPPAAPEPAKAAPTPAVSELPAIPSVPVIGPVASAPPVESKSKVTAPSAEAEAPASEKPTEIPPATEKTASVAKDAAPAATVPEPPPIIVATTAPLPPEITVTPVPRTEFGVDIGGANSVDGLRAIWRGMSRSRALENLRPIIVVKERSNGLGMQLRLVAGPIGDAAAAAKICATLAEGSRPCETTVFDGQRLALKSEPAAPATAAQAPKPQRPAQQRRAAPKPEPAATPAAPKPEQRSEQPPPRPVEEAQAQAPPEPRPTPSWSNLLGFTRE